MQNCIIMSLPIIIIAEVVLPYAITTFDDMRMWSCTCTWMRDNVHYHGNIDTELIYRENGTRCIYDHPDNQYRILLLNKLGIMRNIKYLQLAGNYKAAIAAVRFVDELYIEECNTRDISHISANTLTLDSTCIDTSTIPQVSHLNIYYHQRDINMSHLTKLESLHIAFSDTGACFNLSSMTSLTSLHIEDYVDLLPCMPNLRTLHAPKCHVQDLNTMTNLTELDAHVTDDDLRNLRSLTSLTISPPDIISAPILKSLKSSGVSVTFIGDENAQNKDDDSSG